MDEHQEAVDFLKLLENADRFLDSTGRPPSPIYSPTSYSPTRATTPNVDPQSPDVLSLERIVRALSAQLHEQKESIKKIQQQHERRHLRLVKCITELQAATYHRKRPLESHKEEPAKRKQKETEPFDLTDLRLLQQVLHAPPPPPPLESVSTREQRIKELIGQFLRSWNRTYRCGHFMRDTCKFSESSCFRIHDKTSHSIIAREVRTVLQNAGDARLSPFFSGLIANTEQNNYRYGDTISELQKELDTLSQTLYDN